MCLKVKVVHPIIKLNVLSIGIYHANGVCVFYVDYVLYEGKEEHICFMAASIVHAYF